MSATTIKLEGEVLREILALKAPKQSITDYVRETLMRDARAQRLRDAAIAYKAFLEQNPGETEVLREWENADLAAPPQARARKGSDKTRARP